MSKKYFLVDQSENINDILKQPLQQTQRIKYSSFDVSANYIAFGATSGGVYIFNRRPYQFLKLIPTKEGTILNIAISPDENVIAVTSSRGLVIVIENCFTDLNIRYQIFREHEGHVITSVKWHFNDLYCGDNFGKVSVITLTNILSKAIFHPPSAILMHLGSPVIQLDAYSKFLLVSTKTKTFLCDTEEEQYRQVGKKLRDGEFGACFYTDEPVQKVKTREKEKTIFKILKEDEKFNDNDVEGAKIYCSRPGMRIWEANFNASVVCTYQFKNAINQADNKLILVQSDPQCRLQFKESTLIDNLQFGKIYVANKFIVSFTAKSYIFIFDTSGVNLLFICKPLINIKDIKVVDNYIYIWNKREIKSIAIVDLELLLLQTLTSKQYLLCLDICIKYIEDVKQLLQISSKLHVLNILKDKLKNNESLDHILPILNEIKEVAYGANGIRIVENGHDVQAGCSYEAPRSEVNNIISTSQHFNEKLDIFDTTNEAKSNETIDLSISIEEDEIDPHLDPNYALNILYRQYQVSKLYSNIKTPQFYEVLSSKTLDEIVILFQDFTKHISEMEVADNNLDVWCYRQYLMYVNEDFYKVKKQLIIDSTAFQYITNAYKSINSSSNKPCDCTFPLPSIYNVKIEYYTLGCELCKMLSKTELKLFCQSVPYMWKFYLTKFKNETQTLLPLFLQLSNLELVQIIFKDFNSDLWEDAIRLLIKLKNNICLNCEKKVEFDTSMTISWKEFASNMVKSLGGAMAVKLLLRYSKHIDSAELGMEFYQSCIFSTIYNEPEKCCKFIETSLKETHLYDKFESSMIQYLSSKHTGTFDTKEFTKATLMCSFCDLPLKAPLLEDGSTLVCGHTFHVLCLNFDPKFCPACDVARK